MTNMKVNISIKRKIYIKTSSCINSVGFLISYKKFITKNKQLFNNILTCITHYWLPVFPQLFDFSLEKIFWFGFEEVGKTILHGSVVYSTQIVGGRVEKVVI